MNGNKSYVSLVVNQEGVTAVWGPFATYDEAASWEGIPSGLPTGSSYSVEPIYEAPSWAASDD